MKFVKVIKKFSHQIGWTLLILSILYLAGTIYLNKQIFLTPYSEKNSESRYLESQWRVPNSKKPISDSEFYTYSGYQYIRGGNPILTNPEQPPLGKYIIGFSILIFSNGNVASLIFSILVLIVIYKLVLFITGSTLMSPLAVFLTSIHSLFIDQIVNPAQLDIFQAFFFLLMSYCYLKFQHNKQNYYLYATGISLGALLSIKVFIHSLLLMGLFYLCLLIWQSDKQRRVKELLVVFIIAGIVFISTYASYFLHGGTLYGLLGVQKWIMEFYRSSSIEIAKIFGSFLPLILINKWRVWSDGYPYVSYERWSILWPVYFAGGIYACFRLVREKIGQSISIKFFIVWIIIYCIDLAFVPVFPRYLLLLFIPIIIVFSIFIHEKYKI